MFPPEDVDEARLVVTRAVREMGCAVLDVTGPFSYIE
jgi:hypothetical protein